MTKLLYISNLRIPTEKAYGIQITKMCEAFAVQGLEVELLIPFRKNPSGKDIFEYYGINKNFKVKRVFSFDFYLPGELDKIAFFVKNTFSALSLFFYSAWSDGIIFSRDELPVFLLSFFRSDLCFEAHKFSKRKRLFYRRFKKSGVKIVVISGGLKEEFLKFGFNSDKILIAHDGVDLEEFNIKESSEDCRVMFNLPKDKKIIGYVGQLRTMGMEKGIGELIEAVSILKKELPDVLLAIVGGNSEDIKFYKNIAKEKGMSENIIFFGRREHKEIPYFLRAFDILAMPFPNTTHYAKYMSPLKMFEYMAAGKPIISTDLSTIKEILNEQNAVLVKPDDAEELTEGLKKVLFNSDKTTMISGNAIKDVGQHTWRERAGKIKDFMIS